MEQEKKYKHDIESDYSNKTDEIRQVNISMEKLEKDLLSLRDHLKDIADQRASAPNKSENEEMLIDNAEKKLNDVKDHANAYFNMMEKFYGLKRI